MKKTTFAILAALLFCAFALVFVTPTYAATTDERPVILTLEPFVGPPGPIWQRTAMEDGVVAHIYNQDGAFVYRLVSHNGYARFGSEQLFQQPNGWVLVFMEADGFQLPEPIELTFRPFLAGDDQVWFAGVIQYFDELLELEPTPQPESTPAPEPTPPATPTLDLTTAGSWAREDITRAVGYDLVPTVLQGNFDRATTRAEFAALAVALYENVNGEITGRVTFTDTNDVNVQKMAYLDVVTGVGNNRFNPSGTITREQAAVLLARLALVMGQPFPASAPTFADNASIASWAADGVGAAQAAEIVGGVGNNHFNPQGTFTREQSIVTMLRMYGLMA